jgi:response regulator RpfG family c-di-GMP phosphodiesterase
MSDKKLEVLFVGSEPELHQRCEGLCREFEYSFATCKSADDFADNYESFGIISVIVLSAASVSREADVAGLVQVVKQFAADSFILVVADKKLKPESAVFIKKSGANLVMLENEVLHTCKLEFVTSQKIKSSMIPMKVSELVKDTTPDFTIYHMMPLNRKFLPVFHAGQPLTEAKLKKVATVGEVYLKREEISKYKVYINTYQDKSAAGLNSRCRAQFLELSSAFIDLILLIIDQSEHASYDTGKVLLERCSLLASDLLMSLGSVGDAWSIINNSAVGEFGSVERAPAVAAYSGLYSLMGSIGNQDDAMLAALLSDIGLLELNPRSFQKLRHNQDLHAEDILSYEKHPVFSLNLLLSRKLPLTEIVKNIILHTHERSDGKGFPNKARGEKVPMESFLVAFSELVDRGSLISWGKLRVDPNEVRKQVFNHEYEKQDRFGAIFLEKIKKVLQESGGL